jgi:hypothetical protein
LEDRGWFLRNLRKICGTGRAALPFADQKPCATEDVMTRHLVAASILAAGLIASPALARAPSLTAVKNHDPILSTARIKDSKDRTIGAVQAVQLDSEGHALSVEVALLHHDSTMLINADRFLYDARSNTLVATRSLNG